MTGLAVPLMLTEMGKPGRRTGTPAEFRLAFIRKTKELREASHLSQTEMARELSRRAKRPIVYDTYRKWEDDEGAMLPHDLISHFCDVLEIHPLKLLDPGPFAQRQHARSDEKRRANSRM